jgi:PTS system nitrogen regulatory IIA component
LGQGVAIPHGRIKGLGEAVAAFIRTKNPVPFGAPDGLPVSLVFVLLVPEAATGSHLQILSELTEMLSKKNFRESLLSSRSQAEVYRLIYNWTPNVPDQDRAIV